jgi:hypothetical protein
MAQTPRISCITIFLSNTLGLTQFIIILWNAILNIIITYKRRVYCHPKLIHHMVLAVEFADRS